MQGEHLLHADAVGHPADGNGFLNAAVLLGDDDALVNLDTLTGTFLDLHVHLHSVADLNSGHVLDLGFGQFLDEIHGIFPPNL